MDTIYTISGRAWFRDSLNAVAAFTQSSGDWVYLIKMATILSVIIAAITYVRTHDRNDHAPGGSPPSCWSPAYCSSKRSVRVIDISDATAVYHGSITCRWDWCCPPA